MTLRALQRLALCGAAVAAFAAAPVVPSPAQMPAPETAVPAADAVCSTPLMRLEKRCDDPNALLCLDTPPGGVLTDRVTIRGRVNLASPSYAGLLLSAQHDQTKQTVTLPTAGIVDTDGRFVVSLPLAQLGSYTVVVQALRMDGAPAVESTRVSRVETPNVAAATLAIEPAPDADGVIAQEHATVVVDLLPQCEQCDRIGSETGAVTVVVDNVMQGGGVTRHVARRTDVGSDGVYRICMPLAAGANHLTARVCDPSQTDETTCPALPTKTVQARTEPLAIEWREPTETVSVIDATTVQPLHVAFAVHGMAAPASCDPSTAPVTIQWNHAVEVGLCPANGEYRSTHAPVVGVNLAIVRVKSGATSIEQPIVIGWGALRSATKLHQTPQRAWLDDALTLGLSQHLLGDVARPLLNHFLQSEQMGALLQQIFDGRGSAVTATPASQQTDARQAAIRAALPHCADTGGPTDMRIELAEPPAVGDANVTQIALQDRAIQLAVEFRHVKILLRYFHDANHDGEPDGPVLPLKVAFERLRLAPRIEWQGTDTPTVLLTAATTDCEYRAASYCTGAPAVLVPTQYQGEASPSGLFVVCDMEEQHVPDAYREACAALNRVNEQTGLLSGQILEAVNTMAYCGGSTVLTDLARQGLPKLELPLPTVDGREWKLPVQLRMDLLKSRVSSRGIWARIATNVHRALGVGEDRDYGYFAPLQPPPVPTETAALNLRDVSANLLQDLLNQVAAVVAIAPDRHGQGGPLDWDLHEGLLQQWGIDFQHCGVRPADAASDAVTDSPLCPLRPRVGKLLGSALTDQNYLPANQPLLLKVRGSRRLAPRVTLWHGEIPVPRVHDTDPPMTRPAQLVDVIVPDLAVTLYALDTDPKQPLDPSGQPAIRYDANGKPVIHSMAPAGVPAERGEILTTHLTMILTAELGTLRVDPAHPEQLQLPVWLVPSLSRFSFSAAPEENKTLANATTMLGATLQVLQIGLDKFKRADDDSGGFTLPLPKRYAFDTLLGGSGLPNLGITDVAIDPEHFGVAVDPKQSYLHVETNLSFIQRLRVRGVDQEWKVPE